MDKKWDEKKWKREVRKFRMKQHKRKAKRTLTRIAGMTVRTKPLTVRKRSSGPVKQLPPAPLPRNSAGFGKGWIGDDLYIVNEDRVIPKAALNSMREWRGRWKNE